MGVGGDPGNAAVVGAAGPHPGHADADPMRCGARKEGAGVARHAGKRERPCRRGDDALMMLVACSGCQDPRTLSSNPPHPAPGGQGQDLITLLPGAALWAGTAQHSRGQLGPSIRGPTGRGTHRRHQSQAELGLCSQVTLRSPLHTPALSLGWQKDQQAVAHGVLGPELSALGRMALCALSLPSPGWAGDPETAPSGPCFPHRPGTRDQKRLPSP